MFVILTLFDLSYNVINVVLQDTHYQVTEHQQTGTMKNTVTQVKPGILEIKGST